MGLGAEAVPSLALIIPDPSDSEFPSVGSNFTRAMTSQDSVFLFQNTRSDRKRTLWLY